MTEYQELPIYLIVVSYNRPKDAMVVINDFIRSEKPNQKTKLIIVENSLVPCLSLIFNFSEYSNITYFTFRNSNKSASVNYIIKNLIPEKEAFIVHIDNDISFKPDYLLNYYEAALLKGNKFFFGSSFYTNIPDSFDFSLLPFLPGSAQGKPDEEYQKKDNPTFLGFSYAFFKSQWEKVKGFDERFGPGSDTKLSGDESVFQKKLKRAGFLPFFVQNNSVLHKPLPASFQRKSIRKRQENNGYTYGFKILTLNNRKWKSEYFKLLFYLFKRTGINLFKDKTTFLMRLAYATGFLKAFFLYIRIENKKSFLDF